jgi:hypothetical protein
MAGWLVRRRRSLDVLAALGVALMVSGVAQAGAIRFEDVSTAAGILGNPFHGGHAAAVGDVNGDGYEDVYVTNCGTRRAGDGWAAIPNELFLNNGDGTFREAADESGVAGPLDGDDVAHGAILVDLDADGDLDLVVGTGDPDYSNRLYVNDGRGHFAESTAQMGLSETPWQTRAVCASDVDGDGWTDLYFTNADPAGYERREGVLHPANVFVSQLGRAFVGEARGIAFTGFTQGAVMADLTGDGRPDLAQAQWGGSEHGGISLGLFVSDGHGHFTDARAQMEVSGIGLPLNGVDAGDYDHDGYLDLLVLGDEIRLLHSETGDRFRDVTNEQGLEGKGFSAIFADFDNDAWLDIFVANTEGPFTVYRNNEGRFERLADTGAELQDEGGFSSRAVSLIDFDQDGRMDVFIARKRDPNVLLRNTSEAGRSLRLLLHGQEGAIGAPGARVWVYGVGHMGEPQHLLGYAEDVNSRGYLCQHSPALHFGLGDGETVDVRVLLPTGRELSWQGLRGTGQYE